MWSGGSRIEVIRLLLPYMDMDLESAPCGPEENEDESRELTEEELP